MGNKLKTFFLAFVLLLINNLAIGEEMGQFSDLQKIKVIVLDIDGVCTDGVLYYNANGEVSKGFNSQDGIAMNTARKLGIDIAVITGRNDPAVAARMKDLNIKLYYYGNHAKLNYLAEIKNKLGLEYSQMAYVGDDWIDIDPMRKVGYPIAVDNARPEVKAEAAYITKAKGGQGAVREAVEHILLASYSIEQMVELWTEK